jgi:hypothetical protein
MGHEHVNPHAIMAAAVQQLAHPMVCVTNQNDMCTYECMDNKVQDGHTLCGMHVCRAQQHRAKCSQNEATSAKSRPTKQRC